ncbi:hypothetical protein TELCIR_17542 [Teladorsagia circumcincta]|uniref:Uncharacterized protein n=1 Tax=Teladorsagia circumcincta TaxID=45464 RepID=A0A2G9TSI1_TELCI|nr:hypothetical protein TELCIR_17542 [Teladorsagia circumcincta]
MYHLKSKATGYLVLLVLSLASTGMVLARYRLWETYETRGAINATELAAVLAAGRCLAEYWIRQKNYQTNDYEEAILCPMMGLLLFCFLACLVFIVFINKYHQYLRQRYGHQVPKFVQPRPRTTYQDEVY